MERFSGKIVTTIVLCAGSGQRTGLAYNKILHYIGAKTVLETTLDKFEGLCDHMLCVCSERDKGKIDGILSGSPASVCIGGSTRSESVRRALAAAPRDTDIVVIHDGARPFVSPDIIAASIESAIAYGSGIAAVSSVDAVKLTDGNNIVSLDKSKLLNAQTPQTFRYGEICRAYGLISADAGDDCEIYEKAGYSPSAVPGDYSNIKITTHEDLFKLPPHGLKIGAGFDVHRLAAGRKLTLGGITVPYESGLLGHSDADVLTHAIMDAVLSASGLPDIGVLFPDTDARYKDADSVMLFGRVCEKMRGEGYRFRNISAVIMAEKPKLAAFIPSMRERLAAAAGISAADINISATTTEQLGIVGEGKGIAASCSCLLERIHAKSG